MSTATQQKLAKILCVDDDPSVPTAIKRALSKYAVEVQSAFFGKQGIWLAVTENPDVIITDIRMPHGNGDYLIQCLKGRSDKSNIPIIVLSGCAKHELERCMLMLGADRYLRKPLDMPRLIDTLRQIISLPLLQPS